MYHCNLHRNPEKNGTKFEAKNSYRSGFGLLTTLPNFSCSSELKHWVAQNTNFLLLLGKKKDR
jgi:hypothetical protein